VKRNPKIVGVSPNRSSGPGKVKRVFNEAFDAIDEQFPDIGTVELHEDEAAGSDNGAGSERQFAYCKDGNPLVIAFAPKVTGLPVSHLRGLMRHEFGHALEYRYGVKELERRFGRLPAEVERRADAIAEAVWGEPIRYDSRDVQCVGVRGKSPRPGYLPDAREKLKPNASSVGPWYPPQPDDDEWSSESFVLRQDWGEHVLQLAERHFGHEPRIFLSREPLGDLYDVPLGEQKAGPKPRGLWYSCGLDWIRWATWEMPHWLHPHVYGIQLDLTNVLLIRTEQGLDQFTKEFGIDGYRIDWPRVARRYWGVEICPYQTGRRMSLDWYYPWDVASGCVWDMRAVQRITDITPKTGREPEQVRYLLRSNPPPSTKLTAYHGAKRPMAQPTEFREPRNIDFGPGFYMATAPEDAARYGSVLYRAEIELKNPILLTDNDDPELLAWFQRVLRIGDENLEFYDNPMVGIFDLVKVMIQSDTLSGKKLIAVLQRKGYDGIYVDKNIVAEYHEGMAVDGDYVVLWSPDQVLSWEKVDGEKLKPNRGNDWHFEGVDSLIDAAREAEPDFQYVDRDALEDHDGEIAWGGDAWHGHRVGWRLDNAYAVVEVPVEKVQFMEGNAWNFSHAAALLDMVNTGGKPVFDLPAARLYRISEEDVVNTQREYDEDELAYERGMDEPWKPRDAGTFYVQLLNGNHRALAAMAANESSIFVTVGPNYRDDVREDEWVVGP
jgi:hypothetical protein